MNLEGIKKRLLEIRKQKKKCYTNYFNQCDEVSNSFEFDVYEGTGTIVFTYFDDCVNRVYFMSNCLEELKIILSSIKQNYVLDYITRKPEECKDIFIESGFELYAEYARFGEHIKNVDMEKEREIEHQATLSGLYKEEYGEIANEEDAEIIDKRLREIFDPYESHFYSIETLKDMIRKGWVWVTKIDGKIMAVNIFTIQGKTKYGNFMYNDGTADMIYSVLQKSKKWIFEQGIEYAYCWMDLKNKKAIRYNTKIGHQKQDGLYDMIYKKR